MEEGTSSASAECIDDAAHLYCLDTETRRLEPWIRQQLLWMSGLGRGTQIEPARPEVTTGKKSCVTEVLGLLSGVSGFPLRQLSRRVLIDACLLARFAWNTTRMAGGFPAL